MLVSDCNGGRGVYWNSNVDEAGAYGSEEHNGVPESTEGFASVEGVEDFGGEVLGLHV